MKLPHRLKYSTGGGVMVLFFRGHASHMYNIYTCVRKQRFLSSWSLGVTVGSPSKCMSLFGLLVCVATVSILADSLTSDERSTAYFGGERACERTDIFSVRKSLFVFCQRYELCIF